jgi:hypothetical protein
VIRFIAIRQPEVEYHGPGLMSPPPTGQFIYRPFEPRALANSSHVPPWIADIVSDDRDASPCRLQRLLSLLRRPDATSYCLGISVIDLAFCSFVAISQAPRRNPVSPLYIRQHVEL